MLKAAYQALVNPRPEHANRSLMLVVALWGLPSFAMLVVPAIIWHMDGRMSVPMFACSVAGLVLMLAYGRFVIDFIGRYNGENWLRDQIVGDDE